MDKIIFLDFDGVMMCGRHAFPSSVHEGFEFHPKSVGNIREIINKTAAKIVVTSTYRRMYNPDVLKERFLAPYQLDKFFIGITPTIKGGRGNEIRSYIENNQVQEYVIFDDLPIQGYGRRFFQTNPFEGITECLRDEAIHLLDK
jgi:hypothetical protein